MENSVDRIYQNILESLSDGVIVIGYDGKISSCNDAACELIGIDKDEATGKSIALLMMEIEGNDDFFEMLLDCVYEKKKISRTVAFRKDGKMEYLKVTSTLLMEGGVDTALIAVISDQTEVTELLIKNNSLTTQITALMNSFVEVMVTAVEEKSSYNANHTRNMVRYATNYLEYLKLNGRLKDKTSENIEPFIMSVWLHDIGKLLVPPEVMDKPTRLAFSKSDIRHKIDIAKLMIRVKVLTHELDEAQGDKKLLEINEYEEYIKASDTMGFLDDERIARLKEIANTELYTASGDTCPLLDDYELENITVVRGTLTSEQRKIIESHVELTSKLLSKMEFVGEYKNVPFWAGSHHELLNGTGYPNKLKGDEIPWETRLLTIIDIYDALTAEDRPYKPPLPIKKAFAILRSMADEGKLDKEILEDFYESRAWEKSKGVTFMKQIRIEATKDNLDEAMNFIGEYLEEAECSMKHKIKIDLAVEELYVNICNYAYAPGTGPVTIQIGMSEDKKTVFITFIDKGIPYDPIEKEDPDITLSGEEREVGGLGIFLVKKYMDDVKYKYEGGCNNLTISKVIA
ncbi:MAG: ATP-binding protein [Saccharofermentans sp.]|nr:ATP-binding protein [Saccharofermentans sp.]